MARVDLPPAGSGKRALKVRLGKAITRTAIVFVEFPRDL